MNHLLVLGKTFERDELNAKVLKSINRTWHPKSKTIFQSKGLTTMTIATLFSKLKYELELGRLKDEEFEKKKKGLALKTSTSHNEASDEDPSKNLDNESMNFLVKKFSKFLKKKRRDTRKFQKNSTKKIYSTPITYTSLSVGSKVT